MHFVAIKYHFFVHFCHYILVVQYCLSKCMAKSCTLQGFITQPAQAGVIVVLIFGRLDGVGGHKACGCSTA